MNNASTSVPAYLLKTHQMLKCVFTNDIPAEDYYPLLALLKSQMSLRNVATAIASISSKDYAEVYNDLGRREEPSRADLERIQNKLQKCGYADWLTSI